MPQTIMDVTHWIFISFFPLCLAPLI
uniref:Uncharacterized protein n=1 Tax=Anguilla anguilla TaxID=7936 RepID=A0A0E9Q4E0_ANGAN